MSLREHLLLLLDGYVQPDDDHLLLNESDHTNCLLIFGLHRIASHWKFNHEMQQLFWVNGWLDLSTEWLWISLLMKSLPYPS